mgnify:CR=1 FL=1
MGYDSRRFYSRARKAPRLALYLAVLVKEMVYECFLVIGLIWRKGQPDSMLVRFRSTLKSEGLRVLVANSITLTPGTITMDIAEQDGKTYYYIHWIDVAETDREKAGEIIKGSLEKGIGRIWQ